MYIYIYIYRRIYSHGRELFHKNTRPEKLDIMLNCGYPS